MKTIQLCALQFFIVYCAFAQTADFSYTSASNTLCVPATINFTENCSGNPTSFIWNFGNNNFSKLSNPSFTFTKKGVYQVSLTAMYADKSVVVSKTIMIDSAKAIKISADKNFICTLGTINFSIEGSTTVSSSYWHLGNGQPPVEVNSSSLSYNFQQYGNDSVYVVATENSGCIDTASLKVAVLQPPIFPLATPSSGCIPDTVKLAALVSVPKEDIVTNYQWNFADGSPNTNTNTDSIFHIYSNTGIYYPVLTVTTKNGCTNFDTFPPVAFGTPPVDLSAYPVMDTLCASDSMQVHYKSKSSQTFIINWNDGNRSFVIAGDNFFSHKYDTLGSFLIKVLPYNNGCQGTAVNFKVFIKGVVARFKFNNDCTNKMLFTFSNTSLGTPTSLLWNFGDGATLPKNNMPAHLYNSFDSFLVNLSLVDTVSHCTDSAVNIVYVSNPLFKNNNNSVCVRDSFPFEVTNSFSNPLAKYEWYLLDKNFPDKDTSYIKIFADSIGSFNNYVLIKNGAGYCTDTVKALNPFFVRGANLKFTFPENICGNSYLNVINNTPLSYLNDSVKSWNWNFYNAQNPFSKDYQPAAPYYPTPGKQEIILSAVDQFGCTDSLLKYVTVNTFPFIQFSAKKDTFCSGQVKEVIALHSDSLLWSPANLVSCATCDTTLISPDSSAQIIATATSSDGCITKDTIMTTVFQPFNISASFTDTSICLHDFAQINLNTNNKPVSWVPSAGLSSATITNPIASPNQTTQYNAIVSDSVGCFTDTLPVTIHVNNLPVVDAGPDAQYATHSSFTLQPSYGEDVAEYSWTPSSFLSCSSCAIPNGTADFTQTYTVKVKSQNGCYSEDSVIIFAGCENTNLMMPTAFTPNNDGRNDFYFPLGNGIKIIKKFGIYNRFGQMVFAKQNFPANANAYGWNGKINGLDQPAGTYVYVVEFVCVIGETFSEKGSFILLR